MRNRSTRRAVCAVVGIAAAALVVSPPPASASTYEKVKVVRVLDGDTIDVDRNHDGRIDARIRLLGIDAPEHGLCNFTAATNALKSLVRHKVVELRSQKGRTGIMHRLERRVIVPIAGGKKVDASTWMLERGWGVWMPREGEVTGSLQQHQAADRAAAAGLGWFNSTRCGTSYATGSTLTMQAEYLSDGGNGLTALQKRNQEFIRIRNDGSAPVDIDGWTLRVGNDRRKYVPAGGPIPPGGAVDIHVGAGTNTATDRYLGSSVPMLVNASIDGGPHLGSGSYLIDKQNNIRAHQTWPCTLNCGDPTGGTLKITDMLVDGPGVDEQRMNGEHFTLTNTGTAPVRLGDFVVEVAWLVHEFGPNRWLDPGQSVTVYSGEGDSGGDSEYLHATGVAPLRNAGARVLLRTYDAIVLDCRSWGDAPRCPR
jgi:endonuclease YncB( thermonuclease family)